MIQRKMGFVVQRHAMLNTSALGSFNHWGSLHATVSKIFYSYWSFLCVIFKIYYTYNIFVPCSNYFEDIRTVAFKFCYVGEVAKKFMEAVVVGFLLFCYCKYYIYL